MSACMSGTRDSGVLSSTGDVLMRGVGGVCDMCMCLARGGEWMRELGLGFTNPLGTGGVGHVSVFWLRWCRWVGGLDRGRERWCYVCVSLDSRCRWQVQVSVYCAWRIPAHLRCTQCSILLHLMDICFLTCICLWQISQIQTFLFKVVGPGLVSDITRFCEQQRQPSSGSACPKNGKSGPHWGRGGSTQFAQQLETTVTATPLVGCVVWSLLQPLSHDLSDSGDMEVFIDHPNTETWQGHLSRNFVSAYLASLPSRESTGASDSAHYQQISPTCSRPARF